MFAFPDYQSARNLNLITLKHAWNSKPENELQERHSNDCMVIQGKLTERKRPEKGH